MNWFKIDRAFAMAVGIPNAAHLDTLLTWIGAGAGAGGAVVVGTFVRNWITNKMRDYEDRKKAHLEELKDKVLSPIREGLSHNFSASVSLRVPLLAVQWAQLEFDERARVTEEPAADGEVLVAPFPTARVFGPIHAALLEDARKNHFPKLIARIDRFLLSEWGAYLSDWHSWALSVSREILKRSGLEAYPPKQPRQGPDPKPYVMHHRLALFVYNRLAGFANYSLAVQQQSSAWTLTGASTSFALGSLEQMEAIVALLDRLLETERPRAAELRGKAAAFHEEFNKICADLDSAIAAHRPRGRCDLVTLF